MKLTPNLMAYWVGIFCLIWIADIFDLLQKYEIDDKSVAIGFVLGALLMKFAPNQQSKTTEEK